MKQNEPMIKPLDKMTCNKGFTLLEIMVAMVIFAVGMLGLAGIQGLSMENSHTSYSRTQAVLLAYDIVDRMKANSDSASYAVTAAAVVAEPANDNKCNANNCSVAEMTTYDQWQWKTSLSSLLVTGKGQIVNTSGTSYQITVHWDEDRTGATDTVCPATDASHLRCFQLVTTL